jgi:signal transduction histidine kinase
MKRRMSTVPDFQADVAAIGAIAAVPTILEVVCRSTGMGFAAVARLTDDRWIACQVRDQIDFGLKPGGELVLESTICNEIRQTREAVMIDHVAESPTYAGHHTPALYGFQSYISVPIIRTDGSMFGTLCAIDPRPACVDTPEVAGMFKLFAELISAHLDTQERLDLAAARLVDEQRRAELRDQFIAVLGHDLRNPLASIDAGMRLLKRTPLNERATTVVSQVQTSVARMAGLINNVLDFARGRLGGGLCVTRTPCLLAPVLEQVVAEERTTHPHRTIETELELDQVVSCDAWRVAELLSNLLSNALSHGAHEAPVTVRATTAHGLFELVVANRGEPVPPEAMHRLFQPFERGAVRPNQQGLGLGLYIAAEIARAHGGELTVSSSADQTDFTLRMPLA